MGEGEAKDQSEQQRNGRRKKSAGCADQADEKKSFRIQFFEQGNLSSCDGPRDGKTAEARNRISGRAALKIGAKDEGGGTDRAGYHGRGCNPSLHSR